MKRLIYTMFLIFCQTFTFAQRGKVRPEWDINGGGSHHSIDDDLYSFLFIVGLVALYFLFLAIRGAFSRSRGNTDYLKNEYDHNSVNSEYSGKYKKTGYSSSEPVNNEEIPKWTPIGDAFTLKEICDETGMFNYDDILGDEAELIGIEFGDGSSTLRIAIPFKDGSKTELKAGVGIQKHYDEGDKVKVNLIYGQELHKIGHKNIVRYDVWKSEEEKKKYVEERDGEEPSTDITEVVNLSTEVTEKDLANAWTDEYGVMYSKDKNRLLKSPEFKKEYSFSDEYLSSMYNMKTLETIDKVVKDPIQRAYAYSDHIKKYQEYKLPPKITEYTINEGTLVICDYAFVNCDGLIKIILPLSLEKVGSFAFEGCDNLASFIIPKGSRKKFEQLLPDFKDLLIEHTSYDSININ